ncbi:MAG: hypothetical protein Q7K43_04105, partial [Candidatus Woesearchaeota archaeon]|nr:hypothetical protein [Candidatus Woesearchaeota archaeon]
KNKMKHIFFIDDMISRPRLVALASVLQPLGVTWWCQLRPTKDLLGIFQLLYDSGCRSICWGVESGSQRILDLMKKGTEAESVPKILAESYHAGILNTAYILFGFPGETRDEFQQTIDFLKKNKSFLSIVSTSVFGLQEGSYIAGHVAEFGVTKVVGESRSWLDPKLSYTVEEGLSNDKVKRLRGRFSKTLNSCNILPRVFKDYKEQVLLLELLQRDTN